MSEKCNCGGHVHHAEEESKYNYVLSEYACTMSDEEVAAAVKQLIEKKVEENNTLEVKKFLFNCIDLTTLKCTDSEESVMAFTEKVNVYPRRDGVIVVDMTLVVPTGGTQGSCRNN